MYFYQGFETILKLQYHFQTVGVDSKAIEELRVKVPSTQIKVAYLSYRFGSLGSLSGLATLLAQGCSRAYPGSVDGLAS